MFPRKWRSPQKRKQAGNSKTARLADLEIYMPLPSLPFAEPPDGAGFSASTIPLFVNFGNMLFAVPSHMRALPKQTGRKTVWPEGHTVSKHYTICIISARMLFTSPSRHQPARKVT